ncbi:hypothetical protein RGQ29_031828 [Quercus rubra]|uniref:Uncharacterized protein n=1 Tax=Quercus rubra TaxID=3512 RepID=A0AAN7DUL5_QUERU|nr:hypothetical protein RGQ29_031828 [Quercus rubra]
MKWFSVFSLLMVFFLFCSNGPMREVLSQECPSDIIVKIVNCLRSKDACITRCIAIIGESFSGYCIDKDTCCCHYHI